jgi:hypothetical protein
MTTYTRRRRIRKSVLRQPVLLLYKRQAMVQVRIKSCATSQEDYISYVPR